MRQIIVLPCLAAGLLAACAAPETKTTPEAAFSEAPRAVPGLSTDTVFAAEVRDAFLHAWNGYEQFAWGHDDLRPLSLGWHDWYAQSMVMTPVDAWDTMHLMGLDEEADRAKGLIFEKLSFDHDMPVQVFEVTIRILGGLLSAYQSDGAPRWLALATDLGDRLLPAFDSPTGMPYVRVNLATGVTEEPANNPAEIGTLTLEFGLLSKLTGDPRYYDAVKRGVTEVYQRRSPLDLVGEAINVESGEWMSRSSHVSGRIDSYYEYLLKAGLLFDDPDFQEMWQVSRDALNVHVAQEVNDHLWYGEVDMDTGARTGTRFGALDSFLPAVLALGGDLDRAARLQESVDMFHRVRAAARTPAGFAHLQDVRTGEQSDAMQSFFLAETLKYAYLLADPSALDFDSVVFNTEAHPLKPVGAG